MNLKRTAMHLLGTHRHLKKAFPRETLIAIEAAIAASEALHLGEIRFVVESALDIEPLLQGQSARDRAIEVFSQLRVWDTVHNNGVLIYVLLADRVVEIVADRAIHAKVDASDWEQICRVMETAFQQANYKEGAIRGVQAVTQQLLNHFPLHSRGLNELSNRPVLL